MRVPRMGRWTSILVGALLVLAVVIWVAPRGGGDSAVIFERDIIYGKGGGIDLRLNLARPKSGEGPFPAVLFLHGEGWRAGDRSDMDSLVQGMARLGYVGVTIQYRLVPQARFPAQVEDCKTAIRWMRAHATQYRIDHRKVGVVGFSAGGYLAAMLGVTGTPNGIEGKAESDVQSSAVDAVVSFFGPTDFTTRDWPADLEREIIVPFLGGRLVDRPDVYQRASPINLVTKEAPPFLFFHGADDELVPIDQSIRLAAALQRVGVPARVVTFAHERHGFTDAANQVAMKQMLDFFGERFR